MSDTLPKNIAVAFAVKKKKFAIDCQVVTKIDLKHSDEKC